MAEAVITLLVDDGAGRREARLRDPVVTIGRGRHNAIVLQEKGVSRHHALIRRHEEGYVLVDLGAGNGTRLNQERVAVRPLRTGDEVRIGSTRISVVDIHPSPPKRRFVHPRGASGRLWKGALLAACVAGVWLAWGGSARPPEAEPRMAEAALRAFRARVARADRITDALVAEAEQLAARHPSKPFLDLVEDLRWARTNASAEALMNKVGERAETELLEGRYEEALRAAQAAGPDCLSRVQRRIEQDHASVEKEGRRLEALGDQASAIEHYRAHAERFRGTAYAEALSRALDRLAAR